MKQTMSKFLVWLIILIKIKIQNWIIFLKIINFKLAVIIAGPQKDRPSSFSSVPHTFPFPCFTFKTFDFSMKKGLFNNSPSPSGYEFIILFQKRKMPREFAKNRNVTF